MGFTLTLQGTMLCYVMLVADLHSGIVPWKLSTWPLLRQGLSLLDTKGDPHHPWKSNHHKMNLQGRVAMISLRDFGVVRVLNQLKRPIEREDHTTGTQMHCFSLVRSNWGSMEGKQYYFGICHTVYVICPSVIFCDIIVSYRIVSNCHFPQSKPSGVAVLWSETSGQAVWNTFASLYIPIRRWNLLIISHK